MTTGARCRRDQPLQHALQNILAPHDHLHINHERALPVPRGTEYSCRWTLTILGQFLPRPLPGSVPNVPGPAAVVVDQLSRSGGDRYIGVAAPNFRQGPGGLAVWPVVAWENGR